MNDSLHFYLLYVLHHTWKKKAWELKTWDYSWSNEKLECHLWFWQTRNQLYRQVCGLPWDRIHRPCPVDVHKEDTGNIPSDKRVVGPVVQLATERFLGRNTRTWYQISLRENNRHKWVKAETTFQTTIYCWYNVLFHFSGSRQKIHDPVQLALMVLTWKNLLYRKYCHLWRNTCPPSEFRNRNI